MGKIHIEDPEHFRKLLHEMGQRVRDRMEESIIAAARGMPISGLADVVTANVIDPVPAWGEHIMESIRAAAASMPRPGFHDLLRATGFESVEPEPAPPFRWIEALHCPVFPMFPSALTRISIDPAIGCDEFPTLRAELTLPDTPELRRAWRLYNAKPDDPRRMKRCVRLFRRLAAQAIAE